MKNAILEHFRKKIALKTKLKVFFTSEYLDLKEIHYCTYKDSKMAAKYAKKKTDELIKILSEAERN